jgi:putative ABC transport system permease protein
MTVAVALGVFGVGTMLSGYAILTREILRNYLDTNPASATLELDSVTPALLSEVRARPGIAAAEARATVVARVRVGADWVALRLFVISDFDAFRIGTFRSVAGAWPPPEGTMLLERTGQRVLGVGLDGMVMVKTAHGTPTPVRISGLVHDPGLAPSTMEQTGYAYITPHTLAWLGESGTLDELRIVVADRAPSVARVDAAARDLATWLQERGHRVREIQVPPPLRHPHQGQMTGILYLVNSFSMMALILGGILVAAMIASLMARQIREIGVMKAVGASSAQVAGLYLTMVLVFGVLALVLGLPPGVVAGRAFAGVVAGNLNFTIVSDTIPWWVFVVQVAAGLLSPLVVAAVPLLRGSRVTVRQAMDDHGVNQEAFGSRRLDAWLAALRGIDRALLLAVRNTFRRRVRLALTLGLLAAGGAMFMTSRNVAVGWDRITAKVFRTRQYDVDIRFNRPGF